jgi:hypothetical protein
MMMMMAVVAVVDHIVVVVIINIIIVYSDSSSTLFLFRFLADFHEDLGRRHVLLVRGLLERLGRPVVFKVPRSLAIAPGIDHFAIAAVAVQGGGAHSIGQLMSKNAVGIPSSYYRYRPLGILYDMDEI